MRQPPPSCRRRRGELAADAVPSEAAASSPQVSTQLAPALLVADADLDRANPQRAVVQGDAADAAASPQRPPRAGADGGVHPCARVRRAADPQADRPQSGVQGQHGTDQLVHGDAGGEDVARTCVRSTPGGSDSRAIKVTLASRWAGLPKYRSRRCRGRRGRDLRHQLTGRRRRRAMPRAGPRSGARARPATARSAACQRF